MDEPLGRERGAELYSASVEDPVGQERDTGVPPVPVDAPTTRPTGSALQTNPQFSQVRTAGMTNASKYPSSKEHRNPKAKFRKTA